jgi:hypothetical protein
MQQATERRELAQGQDNRLRAHDRSPRVADGDVRGDQAALRVNVTRRSRVLHPHRQAARTGNLLSRGLYPALARAGLPHKTFHALRHTHASLWIKNGGDVVTAVEAPRTLHAASHRDDICACHRGSNDDAVRRSRVDAMYADSQMAMLMSTLPGGPLPSTTPVAGSDNVVDLRHKTASQ